MIAAQRAVTIRSLDGALDEGRNGWNADVRDSGEKPDCNAHHKAKASHIARSDGDGCNRLIGFG